MEYTPPCQRESPLFYAQHTPMEIKELQLKVRPVRALECQKRLLAEGEGRSCGRLEETE